MRLQKLLIKLSQMGSIFIENLDVKVLNAIYPYISKQYGTWVKSHNIKLNKLCYLWVPLNHVLPLKYAWPSDFPKHGKRVSPPLKK